MDHFGIFKIFVQNTYITFFEAPSVCVEDLTRDNLYWVNHPTLITGIIRDPLQPSSEGELPVFC